jgi:outer membrane lipopolysaccharide assembly protein LptE/RlpB
MTYNALPLVGIPTEEEILTDENREELVKNITEKITSVPEEGEEAEEGDY